MNSAVAAKTLDLSGEQKNAVNRAESLQQVLNETAKAVGCPNPALIAQYAGDIQTGLKSRNWSTEKAAKEGAEIRAEDARKLLEQQPHAH